jgi:hypothetical protein
MGDEGEVEDEVEDEVEVEVGGWGVGVVTGVGAEATGTGVGAGVATGTGAGAAATGAAGAAATGAAGAGAAAVGNEIGMPEPSAASRAEMSSPSLPRMARRLSTGAVEPVGTPMWRSTPSKNDSNSMVALSVSISARISPLFTRSPTFFNQLATTPSVMVSLSLGMRTISAMVCGKMEDVLRVGSQK